MRVVAALAVLAVVLATGAVPTGGAGCNANRAWQDRYPSWRSESGIAFQRQEIGCAGPEVVATVSPAGTQFKGLGSGAWPNAGAEGRLAIATSVDASAQLAVGTVRGPLHVLTTGGVPSWSPSGNRLAFVRDGGLWVMNDAGFEQRRLADVAAFAPVSEAHVVTPAWAPDGSRIAFVGPGVRVWIVGLDGSPARPLTQAGTVDVSPSWSPDGRRIAFATRRSSGWDVASVAADGSDERLLAATAADETLPVYSPVADRIAFLRATPPAYGKARLWLMDGAGGGQRAVGEDAHGFSQPAWSPDGSRLAYASGRECLRWGLYVVEIAGGAERRVSNRCRFDGTPAAETLRGTPFLDYLSGFGGADRLFGGRGADSLDGGPGGDVIDAGPGRDDVAGGPGADRILARDATRDAVGCGNGRDTVLADDRDRVFADCELVLRPH